MKKALTQHCMTSEGAKPVQVFDSVLPLELLHEQGLRRRQHGSGSAVTAATHWSKS